MLRTSAAELGTRALWCLAGAMALLERAVATLRQLARLVACVAPRKGEEEEEEKHSAPYCGSSSDAVPPFDAEADLVLPAPPPCRDARWVAVALAPPPDAAEGAACAFTWRGIAFRVPRRGHALLTLTRNTTAATLLAFCAAWLRVPEESLSVAGGALVLSASTPRRTAAEAGLGAESGTGTGRPPVRRVFALPWCAICLSACSGAVWSCRGGCGDAPPAADGEAAGAEEGDAARSVRHRFCEACVRRYATTALSTRSAAALRCPAPGCAHTLQADDLARLVDLAAMRRLRAQRTAMHTARLRDIAKGAEGNELAAMLARGEAAPCPECKVVIQKDGGCSHVVCSVCGASFTWPYLHGCH